MAEMTGKLIPRGTGGFQYTPQRHVKGGRLRGVSQFMAVSVAWVLIGASCLCAQQSSPTEYEVKAAYLYNFGKFVEWPAKIATADDFFTICVLGQDPFGATLDTTITGESINGKKVVVNRIARSKDAISCRILFISSSEESQVKEILAALDQTSVLTVSDMPQFTRRGGMIQFLVEENRVRFKVNLTAAEHAGLTLSSQLLKVAISVTRTSPPGDS
jgi:hypothetical protein